VIDPISLTNKMKQKNKDESFFIKIPLNELKRANIQLRTTNVSRAPSPD